MRVLIVTNDFPSQLDHVAGVFIYKQAVALQRLGHEITVLRVVPFAPPLGAKWAKYRALGDEYEYDGIGVRVARTLVLPRLRNFEHLRAQTGGIVRRAIERARADIVHAHYLQYPGSIAFGRGTPTVITSHGIDAYDWPWRRDGLRRDAVRTLQGAESVVAVSGFIAEELRRLHARRIDVIFNGGDAEIFARAERGRARADLGIPAERQVIAFAGTLCVDKGIFDLARALSGLEQRPLLLALGAGESAHEFAEALRAAGIEARLFGNVTQRDVATAFAAADVVTLPSHKEGLPVTICEAMLCARPVVATTVGGIPEIVTDGETGFLASPHDVTRLTELYANLLSDPQRAAAMGEAGLRFAERRLTWDANARAYDRLYGELLGARAA